MLARIDQSGAKSPITRHQDGLMRQLVQESMDRLGAFYRDWRHERDIAAITRVLERLNDRQLAMLGLSRAMLDVDVERLAIRAAHQEYAAYAQNETSGAATRRNSRQDQRISLFHA